jgi:peptidoglycan/xylan/chitin deacetylase (PgdA/CDA1 family)
MLTFDDGPHSMMTAQILDILKAKNASATFFAQGNKVIDHPHVLKRIITEGHDVANGGWNQTPFTIMEISNLGSQIDYVNNIIKNTTGIIPTLIRAPEGASNSNINEIITQKNMTLISYSLDSGDKHKDATIIHAKVMKKASVGDIILFHEGLRETILALPRVIDDLYKQGYEFLTLSQMLSFPDDKPH